MAREALKALSRMRRGLEDAFLHYEKDADTDRATAILESTSLEDALESAIRSKFVELSKTDLASLFEGDNPIATFSAKIKIGYAIGLYGHQTRADLNCIREIRNAFAHARKYISFRTPEVIAACRELRRQSEEQPLRQDASAKDRYLAAVGQLSMDLLKIAIQNRHNKPRPDLP